MPFKEGNIGGKFKSSYKYKVNNTECQKKTTKFINKFLKQNFISTCSAFCELCRKSKKCPYICDYCNGHNVCKEMCSLPKLTKTNLSFHNKKFNITNDDLLDIFADFTGIL